MLDDSINGFGTQNPNAQGFGAVSNVSSTSAEPGITAEQAAYYKSTIAQSELNALLTMLAAGFPTLQPPQVVATNYRELGAAQAINGAGILTLSIQSEQTKNAIINSMWDLFLKRVHEIEERAKKEDIEKWTKNVAANGGPKSATEYNAYLISITAGQRDKEVNGNDSLTVQFDHTFHRWFIAPLDLNGSAIVNPLAVPLTSDSHSYPSSAFIAGALVTAADALQGPTSGQHLGSMNPVADALFAMGPNSTLPGDYQAAAAMIAALLYGGAMRKATNDTIKGAAQTGKPPQDLDFALNYAYNVMKIVSQPLAKPENKVRSDQDKFIRLMLSVMALKMVYRARYNGMTGIELASLLEGNTSDIHESIKSTVQQLVKLINANLPKDAVERENAIGDMMAYVDSPQSMDSTLGITRMYNEYLTAGNAEDFKRFESGQS